MDEIIIEVIERGGYLGIFFLMVIENVFPPIPSEVIMGVSGILVERGALSFWPLLLIATFGTTLGNCFWYWVGNRFGYQRLKPIVDRWGRWLTLEWQDIETAQDFLAKHGHWVLFFTRFSPFMRTMISLPAGLVHMPLRKFLGFTYAGSLIWNGLLIKGGQWLSGYLEQTQDLLGWVIIALIAGSLALYAWRVATWKPRADRDDV